MEDFETDDVDGDVARDAMRLIAMGRAFLRGGKCEGDDADVVAAHKYACDERVARCGGGGETASHTTPFAWCTPFLKDF